MYEELDESENIIVMKSHNDIDDLIKQYNNKYKLIFISSERKDMDISIDEKYKTYKNVILFDYNELNETTTNTLIKIVDNIYNKVKNVLFNIKLDKTKCIDRINLMNIKYEQIKHEPFTYIDELFALHGSHRNRKE
jgi:ribosomal protein L10